MIYLKPSVDGDLLLYDFIIVEQKGLYQIDLKAAIVKIVENLQLTSSLDHRKIFFSTKTQKH